MFPDVAFDTILLILTFYFFLRVGLKHLLTDVFTNPVLLFMLTYGILCAFAVGLTTPNFGALVRFKSQYMPFIITVFLLSGAKYMLKNKSIQESELPAMGRVTTG